MPSTGLRPPRASGRPSTARRRWTGPRRGASTPRAVEALPCGSRSITSTCSPCRASAAARFTVVVVLPTPPFWFATVRIRVSSGVGSGSPTRPASTRTAVSAARAIGVSSATPRGSSSGSNGRNEIQPQLAAPDLLHRWGARTCRRPARVQDLMRRIRRKIAEGPSPTSWATSRPSPTRASVTDLVDYRMNRARGGDEGRGAALLVPSATAVLL